MRERKLQCRTRVKEGNVTSSVQRSLLTVVICTLANVLEVTFILHVEASEFEKGACLRACFFPRLTSHNTRTYYKLVPSS